MEDNTTPTPRPSVNPRPMARRPMDDFSTTPTPRPMSIPVNSPPEDEITTNDSDASNTTGDMSLSDMTSKINEDIMAENSDDNEKKLDGSVTEPELSQNKEQSMDYASDSKEIEPSASNSTVKSANDESTTESEKPSPDSEVPTVINSGDDAKKENNEELIPGLNTKPGEDAFKDTPVTLSDTSEEKIPDLDFSEPASKSNVGVVTSAQYDKKNKKGRGGMAIVVAVLLAIALIAGAGYAYMQNSKQETPPAQTTPAVTAPVEEPVKASDVDGLNTEIDDSLKKVNDSTDYQESDLTDTTLGL